MVGLSCWSRSLQFCFVGWTIAAPRPLVSSFGSLMPLLRTTPRRSVRTRLFRAATTSTTTHPALPNNNNDDPSIRAVTSSTSTPRTPRHSKRKRPLPPAAVTPEPAAVVSSSSSLLQQPSTWKQLSSEGFCDLKVPPCELRPSATLTTGQCFHWRALEDDSHTLDPNESKSTTSAWGKHNATLWLGTLRVPPPAVDNHAADDDAADDDSLVLLIRETPTTTLYKVLHAPSYPHFDVEAFLRHDYFQLGVPLQPLYQHWSDQCPRLERIAACIPGVRILQQDPWECLVSFLCSSNNNIPRITQMLTALRKTYGRPIMMVGDDGETLYSFPSLQDLKQRATDQELREVCGMGYRAKYLLGTLALLDTEETLRDLRNIDSADAVQEKLTEFPGIGRKVADCIALFSLGQTDAIPVDVHVWNVARRDYWTKKDEETLKGVKSMTPTVYRHIGNLFRNRFSPYSGWAHSVLFVAELPSFRAVLPEDLLEEMDRFRRQQEERKKAERAAKKKKKEDNK